MGTKSGDTVPSRYLDSKFKKVTQEIKHYRSGYLAHTRTCVSKIFTSFLLPSFYFARFWLICVSTRNCGLSAVDRNATAFPSEHFVCGNAGCRELLVSQQHRRVLNTDGMACSPNPFCQRNQRAQTWHTPCRKGHPQKSCRLPNQTGGKYLLTACNWWFCPWWSFFL